MFGNFTEEARKILINAKVEMSALKHPYVGSEHLLLAILKSNNEVTKKLKKHNLTYDAFRNKLIETVGLGSKASEWFLYTPLLKKIMENACIDSKENNSEVTISNLFFNILDEGDGVAVRIIVSLDINVEKLYNEFNQKTFKKRKTKKLLIEEIGEDLTKQTTFDPVIGRSEEIKRMLEILCRRGKNNPLLIGEAGVGKTAIVEELSKMIVENNVPTSLKNKRIISLDTASMVAGTKYRGEFEERIRKILKEIEENDNIILFVDEIHTLVGAGGAEGAIDASNIFKPALARGKIKCIGATTIDEYKKYIENDKALERRFQKIFVEAPDNKTVKEILMKLKPIYEQYHKVIIKENIIDKIIEFSGKYIHNRNQPDKSIDILDELCARTSLKESKELISYNELNKQLNEVLALKKQCILNNDFKKASMHKTKEFELTDKVNNLELILCKSKYKQVLLSDLAEIIHAKTKIPVYELVNDLKAFTKLNNKLDKAIIGQSKAVSELKNIAKKIKLGYKDDNKCYSLMFAGPTGVGKTELAKHFGELMVGKNVIKLDMSEFSESHSISKIVGAPPGYVGYSDNKNILEDIKNNPYTVLILDEIEKAHGNIIHLLYQILDEGKIKDSKGVDVYFNNVIIIMTSNVGFHEINVGFNKNIDLTNKLKEQFSLPFINRIDNIIKFEQLNEEEIKKIISLKLNLLTAKYKTKNIDIKLKKEIISSLVELCSYKDFGARKVEKVIKNKLEDYIIDEILKNKKSINLKEIIA